MATAIQPEVLEVPEITKTEELLSRLVEQVTLLEGKKRRGKTLGAVAISYNLRELFGMNIVTVGSKMGLRDSFGPYQLLDEREFLSELDKITTVTKQTPDSELEGAIDEVLARLGINIYKSCLDFDEAYKLFDSRTPQDKLVRVFGYFIAQSAHYHATILLMSPHRDMIDKRVRRQVDWFGRCYYLRKKETVLIRFKQGLIDTWKLKVPGPKYWHMFDSWTLLGYRKKSLEIEGL